MGIVRDAFTGRRICVIVGNTIREERYGPVLGVITIDRIFGGVTTKVVATIHNTYLRSESGAEIVATICSNEIYEGIDGPLLAIFDGGIQTGMGGAAFLLSLLNDFGDEE
jgi:molybdopterin-binding protein